MPGVLISLLLAHPATPAVVLRHAAGGANRDQHSGARDRALLSNPALTPDILDTVLAAYAPPGHTLPGRVADGVPLRQVLDGFPARCVSALAGALDGLPDRDGQVARTVLDLGPTAEHMNSPLDRPAVARWTSRWLTYVTAAHTREPDRVRAATLLAGRHLTRDRELALVDAAADRPHVLEALLTSAARGSDLHADLRAVADGPREVGAVVEVLRNNPYRAYTYRALASCGPARHIAAAHTVADPTMPPSVLLDVACHPCVPLPVRFAAMRGPHVWSHITGQHMDELTGLITAPGAPAPLVEAHQRRSRWGQALALACAPTPDPHVVATFLDTVQASRGSAVTDAALLAVVLNSDVAQVHRDRAAVLVSRDDDIATTGPVLDAGAHLPDAARAGALLPVPVLTGASWYGAGAQRLAVAALDELAPTIQTPAQTAALLMLAPQFPGTVGELFDAARAIAA